MRQQSFIKTSLYWFGAFVSVLHLFFNFSTLISSHWQATLHFVCLGSMCLLLYPMTRSVAAAASPKRLIIDFILLFSFVSATLWVVGSETAIHERGVNMTGFEQSLALITIFAAIELARRTTGWVIPILILLTLSYVMWWGSYIDGVFNFSGLSVETVLFRSIFGDDALFGSIANISVSYVFLFISFGAFLVRSGASDFIVSLSQIIAGRILGGPGLVAVFASGLTGTISGSSIANTVSTGVITIPMMKRAGFPARFAAGVEASASTGGQLMPPMMGAGAFVMASYTQISYTHIVLIAFLPALLYFLSVGFFVRLEAKRCNLSVDNSQSTLSFKKIMGQGGIVFVLPISVLITLLVIGFTPSYAACIAIIVVIISSWLTPNKMGLKAIIDALSLGSRNMITTGILLVAVGLVINVIAMTGIGNTLSLMIQEWAGGNLLIAILLVAIASLILGMGLPVTAAYIVLATLSAPALYFLMADIELVKLIAAGATLPEAAKAMVMLAAPDYLSKLGHPMSIEEARQLLNALRTVDPSIVTGLYEQVISPALLTSLLLSAHMIIFWLSQDSNVTPPVCLTAFAAAAIAGTKQMQTGFTAWKLSKGLYIIPLLFAYTPFLHGDIFTAMTIFFFSSVALYAFASAFQGYLHSPLSHITRLVLALVAIALLYPLLWLNLIGLLLFMGIYIFDKLKITNKVI